MTEMRPKLRALEVFPVREGDEDLLCLRDPQGFVDKIVTISVGAAPILQLFDGEHSLETIQARLSESTGTVIPFEDLRKFVARLDEALVLDSPRFATFQADLVKQFRASSVREAALAGSSYPARAADLRQMIDKHFASPKGPGRDGQVHRTEPPAALVIPHIDVRRGGPVFAWAYAQLINAPPVDTFVILGVAHGPTEHRFAGTKKHFKTPLGVLPTNEEFMDQLAGKLPFDLYADELAHRHEHSIEFQVVYLQHMFAGKHDFQIAPILVGSFHDLLQTGQEPIKDEPVAAFVKALRETMAETRRRLCVIASVDLAHVGSRFGDHFTVNETVLKQLEAEDRALLTVVKTGNADKLYRLIHEESDRRRVDAWPALYTMLSALDLKHGQLLAYDQSYEEETNSVVTFASLRFS
jgi:MEMO1 family protein